MRKVPTESEVSKALLTCVDMSDVLSVGLCLINGWFEGVGNGVAWRWVHCTEHCCGANGELGGREGLCADAVGCGQWRWRGAGLRGGGCRALSTAAVRTVSGLVSQVAGESQAQCGGLWPVAVEGNGAVWRWVQCTEHCCGANGELAGVSGGW